MNNYGTYTIFFLLLMDGCLALVRSVEKYFSHIRRGGGDNERLCLYLEKFQLSAGSRTRDR